MISETNATEKCAWVSPGSVGSRRAAKVSSCLVKDVSLERFYVAEQVGDRKQSNAVLWHVHHLQQLGPGQMQAKGC